MALLASALFLTACGGSSGSGGAASPSKSATAKAVAPVGTAGLLEPVGSRSGLSWNSGIFPLDRGPGSASYSTALQLAEKGRGRKSDIEQAAQWNDNWDALTSMQLLTFMDPNITASVSLPPFPASGSWKAAAAGDYDGYYLQMGKAIAKLRPNKPTILRLAWEFNLKDPVWKATSSFVAGWRRAVTEIRAGAGDATKSIYFSWCLSGLDEGAGYPPLDLYPGDQYVNFVGVDVYDTPPTTATSFPAGQILDSITAFAVGHGKKIAIEEWGLHHINNGYDGGDDPTFINDMFAWIKSHKSVLLYEQYFQDDAPDNVNSSLFSPVKNANPASSAAYLADLN
jgi:hypothetical protein